MRADIVPGGVFPDYALPDHTETVRRLSELQGDDPMILTLSRGHYCPKEHQQHLDLAAFQPKIAVAYTQIVTIATDEHHVLQEFRASVGASWTFLSDPGRTIQTDLDIKEYTDPDHDPMIPHTLVLKPATGIDWGAQYGALAGPRARYPLACALALGPSAWLSSYVLLPLAKVYKPIWEYDAKTLGDDLSAHLVFGTATAAVYAVLNRERTARY